MHTLITGGAGFIGSHLTRVLLDHGHQVTVIDSFVNYTGGSFQENFAYRKKLINGARLFQTFASDPSAWQEPPKVVVHLAAIPIIKPQKGNFYQENVLETEKVLKLAQQIGAEKFIFMSSIYATGHFTGKPYTEDVCLSPVDKYGTAKAIGEYLVRYFFMNKKWAIIRTAGVVGYGDHNNRVFQLITEKYKKIPHLSLTQGAKRIFVYIDDLVKGIYQAITADVSHEIFNLAGGVLTLDGYAREVKKYYPDLNWSTREKPPDEIRVGPADFTKARKILGFSPRYTMPKAVKKYIQTIEENRAGEERNG